MHQDHVSAVPPGFDILAYNDHTPVQIMGKEKRVICVQGHPEYTKVFVKDLAEYRVKSLIFSVDFFEKLAFESIDPDWLALKIIKYLE